MSLTASRHRRRLILAAMAVAVVSSLALVSTWTEDNDYEQYYTTMGAGHRGLSPDPKSVEPRLRPPVIAESDGPSANGVAAAGEPSDFASMVENLKQSEDLWLRGRFVWKNGGYHSNSKGREEQIASAIASAEEHKVS